MRHSEYEQRKRALDIQLREDIELLHAGHRAKLQALEMVWMISPEAPLPAADLAPALLETLLPAETLPLAETLPASETLPPPPAHRRGDLSADFEAVFPHLPEVFDKRDVVRALGYDAPRATLHRLFSQYLRADRIAMAHHSDGHSPTRYRKLPPTGTEAQ